MILIRGVTKVENCFCYTFFIEIRMRKRFIFHFFKVKHVQERMLREIRMRGNFRAAFFLAEPVFSVAPKNASRPNRLVHVSACRRTIHRILSNIGKTGFIRKEKTQPCNYNILIWQDCFLYMLYLKEGKNYLFPSNFKKERR